MKIYGNKDNKLERIKKKDFELQDKIHKKEDDKIKQPFFEFFIVVFFFMVLLWNFTDGFEGLKDSSPIKILFDKVKLLLKF